MVPMWFPGSALTDPTSSTYGQTPPWMAHHPFCAISPVQSSLTYSPFAVGFWNGPRTRESRVTCLRIVLHGRGGVPLIFPQYGRASGIAAYAGVGSSSIPTNGLLNRMHWSLIGTGVTGLDAPDPAPTAVFATESDESTYAIWPFHFQAFYTVLLLLL